MKENLLLGKLGKYRGIEVMPCGVCHRKPNALTIAIKIHGYSRIGIRRLVHEDWWTKIGTRRLVHVDWHMKIGTRTASVN